MATPYYIGPSTGMVLKTVTSWFNHAGLATKIKVEEEIKKNEELPRYDLGWEKFLKQVWEWKEQQALHESGLWSKEQIEKSRQEYQDMLANLLRAI